MIDFKSPPLWYCILFVAYTAGLISIFRNAIRHRRELSTGSYAVRVFGAGFLLLVALSGIAFQLWTTLR